MKRFFVSDKDVREGSVVIRGDDVHHIVTVLRMRSGDRFIAIDPGGREHTVEITLWSPRSVVGRIIETRRTRVEPGLQVTLLQGLPKSKKMDFIVQKGTELGVSRIVPVVTERTIVNLEEKKADEKRERWQRIAREAAEQCRRTFSPVVGEVVTFEEALEKYVFPGSELSLIPWEEEDCRSLKGFLRQGGRPSRVNLFIGPEGGFTQAEVDLAQEAGVIPVSLGPRILRAETASLAAITMVLYELADLGGGSGG